MKRFSQIGLAAVIAVALASCSTGATLPGNGEFRAERLSPAFRAFFDDAGRSAVATMRRNGIPGLSIAVVDEAGPLWEDGFGFGDKARTIPVSPDTRFSIQSMSKTFTGMAVLAAMQDGLVDLDKPITTYLPEFTVHSIFETNPEQKMTLRLLMTHLAGFTHEAPVGGNFTTGTPTFDQHVASISDTWLRYPVGVRESYSNHGIDLAGYIIETVRGRPFSAVMRDTVFTPFGMERTTDEDPVILADHARADGHTPGMAAVPVITPMLAAGGVWSTAHDIARFLVQMLGEGKSGGPLTPASYVAMRTTANGGSFGIGIAFRRMENHDLVLNHAGGGFGFRTVMEWYPTLGIGVVVLTNAANHESAHINLAHHIIAEMQKRGLVTSRFSLTSEPVSSLDIRRDGDNRAYFSAHAAQGAWKPEWTKYVGKYEISLNGEPVWWAHLALATGWPRDSFVKVTKKDGGIATNGVAMIETEPGLFFTLDGEALDFRGSVPTWRNIPMTRR